MTESLTSDVDKLLDFANEMNEDEEQITESENEVTESEQETEQETEQESDCYETECSTVEETDTETESNHYENILSEICYIEEQVNENTKNINKMTSDIKTFKETIKSKLVENNKKAHSIIQKGFESLYNLIVILVIFEIIMLQVLLYFNFKIDMPHKTIMNILFIISALVFMFFL